MISSTIHSIRFRLIAGFAVVSLIVGGISLFIGGILFYNAMLGAATGQVVPALDSARDQYDMHVKYVKVTLHTTTLGAGFRTSFLEHRIPDLIDRIDRLAGFAGLDFAGIVTESGATLCRFGPNAIPLEAGPSENPITQQVLRNSTPSAGTVLLTRTFLFAENPALAERIPFHPATEGNGNSSSDPEQFFCLAIAAGIPIFETREGGKLIGVLYGGIVLNQKEGDTLRKSFFPDPSLREQNMTNISLFQGPVRVATNLIGPDGKRAVDFPASEEALREVLIGGGRRVERISYQKEHHIAAYAPIVDITGAQVGMISLSVPESNYSAIRNRFLLFFILTTLAGTFAAAGTGYLLARRIMAPVHRLVRASREVANGNLSPDIGPISKDQEMAHLQKMFNDMVQSMKQAGIESRDVILQSEKQASVGRLAAGVAHEINNPLTGVLTYAHMLLRRKDLPEDVRADLVVIVEATDRVRKIVKGLLDFSRQTKLEPERTDINRLVDSTIRLVENQALLKGVSIGFKQGESLPAIVIDQSRIQSVLLNMLINALDAMKPSDTIEVGTAAALSSDDPARTGIEITIKDTGCGIPPENLNKIFDPFFTTKEVGKGTGLGLAVSFGIVREHGGNIRVRSEVGCGSTFFIWLPIEKQVAQDEHSSR